MQILVREKKKSALQPFFPPFHCPSLPFENWSLYSRQFSQRLAVFLEFPPSRSLSCLTPFLCQSSDSSRKCLWMWSRASTRIHLLFALCSPLVARIAHVQRHLSNCAAEFGALVTRGFLPVRCFFFSPLLFALPRLGQIWTRALPRSQVSRSTGAPPGLSGRPIRGAF